LVFAPACSYVGCYRPPNSLESQWYQGKRSASDRSGGSHWAKIENYVDVARKEGFDAVLTISNAIAPSPGVHPTGFRLRKNSRVKVHHVSWTRLLTMAVMEKRHRGVSDPEQAWILGELIRYMQHEASGVMSFDDIGPKWKPVGEKIRDRKLTARSDGVEDVARLWDQLMGFVSLDLGAEIGADVVEVISRADEFDPSHRTENFVKSLCQSGTLAGKLRIPDTIADIEVLVDLRSRQIELALEIGAPSDKTARGRVAWLRQELRDAPDDLSIEAYAKGSQRCTSALLAQVNQDLAILQREDRKVPHRFRVIRRGKLGQGRKTARRRRGFASSVVAAVESFYRDVLQDLTPYQKKAPKLPVSTTVDSTSTP